jgi:hypothetical protein
MKKLLLAIGFTTIASLAHGQGTIAFGNGTLTRVTVLNSPSVARNATTADGLLIGAFYGPAGSTQDYLVLAPGLATIGTTDGIMVNAPSVFALPGTQPGQVVSLQIRMWHSSLGTDWEAVCRANGFLGATDVRQVTLAPTAGPGAVIWQTATGTNPNRFTPLTQALGPLNINCIPEPPALAFAALGGLIVFFVRRKSTRN